MAFNTGRDESMSEVKQKSKKIKVGTILDEELVRRLKERAARERKTMSVLIEEALLEAEQAELKLRERRIAAMEQFLGMEFTISDDDFKRIMESDMYDQ